MNNPSADITEATLNRLHSHNWIGRLLTSAALTLGFLAIAAGVLLAAVNSNRVMPMERLLIWKYPGAAAGLGMTVPPDSPESKPLTRDELDARHVEVTFMHGKELFLTMSAVALVGVGAFLTLLLVLLNRRVTLRQVNASLAQISQQIKEMQQRSPNA